MPPRRKTHAWYLGAVTLMLGAAFIVLVAIPSTLSASWYMRRWLVSLFDYPQPESKNSVGEKGENGQGKWRTLTMEERIQAMIAFGVAEENVLKSYQAQASSTAGTVIPAPKTDPSPFWLIIPSISVNMPVVSGERDAERALRRGAWLMPGTPEPPQGGNTVLTGHRFLYASGAHTLYNLDKVKKGQKLFIEWDGVRYTYEVFEKNIIPAVDVSILNDTEDTILTVVTCDPPYSTKNRLYVRARLLE